MNFVKSLIARARGEAVENAAGEPDHKNAWHTYEHPVTKDRLPIYNLSDQTMPLEMQVGENIYSRVAPFDGVKAPAVFKDGDYVYRKLLKDERAVIVAEAMRARKKAFKRQGIQPVPDHVMKHRLHAEYAQLCGVFQIVDEKPEP